MASIQSAKKLKEANTTLDKYEEKVVLKSNYAINEEATYSGEMMEIDDKNNPGSRRLIRHGMGVV